MNVKDGFDIVIGNPPYIFARNSATKGLSKDKKAYYYKQYDLAEYQVNLYPLFIEAGTYMLRQGGALCLITPNNWLTLNTNGKLRRFVLSQTRVMILNFYARVFESADVDAAIVIFRRAARPVNSEHVNLYEWTSEPVHIASVAKDDFLQRHDCIINIEALKYGETIDLVTKIETASEPLSALASVKCGLGAYGSGDGIPPQTKEMIEKRIYHSEVKHGPDWYKYIEGVDVKRYFIGWERGEYLRWGKHLREPRKDWQLFSSPRILVRQIPSNPPFCINASYTTEEFLNDRNSMNVIKIIIPPELVLSVLNSRLISYWFIHKFGKLQRGIFPQFKVNELAMFPMPKTFSPHKGKLISLVTRILAAKKADPKADTSKDEAEIDRLVYGLYGLTEEERDIIRAATAPKPKKGEKSC